MNIAKANILDTEEILAIQKIAFISTAQIDNDFNIPPLTQTLEELQQDFQTHIFYKAVEGNQIIGSAKVLIQEDNGLVGRVVVLPAFQNKGVGKSVMKQLEKDLMQIKRFELFTGKSNEKNIFFYQKLGYKIYKEEIWNSKITLVYMEKFMS